MIFALLSLCGVQTLKKKKNATHTILNFHIPHFHTEYVFLYIGPNTNMQKKKSPFAMHHCVKRFQSASERETA